MSSSRPPAKDPVGQPFSSRLKRDDYQSIRRTRDLRAEAAALRASMEEASHLFESDRTRFLDVLRRAPSAIGESAAQLQDLAGVGPRCFDDWLRYGRRPSRRRAIDVLTAIIDTANERLLDVEGTHVSRWVDNPYDLDSARDLRRGLEEIAEFLRTSNSIARVPELEDVTRRHLIDLCKTVIALLEGPKIELGILEQCAQALKQLPTIVFTATLNAIVTATVASLLTASSTHCSVPHQKSMDARVP